MTCERIVHQETLWTICSRGKKPKEKAPLKTKQETLMQVIRGDTYRFRGELRALGGYFDEIERVWKVPVENAPRALLLVGEKPKAPWVTTELQTKRWDYPPKPTPTPNPTPTPAKTGFVPMFPQSRLRPDGMLGHCRGCGFFCRGSLTRCEFQMEFSIV